PSASLHELTTTHCITPSVGRDGSTSETELERARGRNAPVRTICTGLPVNWAGGCRESPADSRDAVSWLLGKVAFKRISCETSGCCLISLLLSDMWTWLWDCAVCLPCRVRTVL